MAKRGPTTDEVSTASDTAKVLGKNLEALMSAHPELDSNPKLGKKTDLGTGTISRLRNGLVNANLETLGKLASAFQVEPWQLLVPNIDPGNLPVLLAATEAERRLWERMKELAKDLQGGR